MTAGMIGDQWSLGFVVETERQVIKHLESHLQVLPEQDERSYIILRKMNKMKQSIAMKPFLKAPESYQILLKR